MNLETLEKVLKDLLIAFAVFVLGLWFLFNILYPILRILLVILQ